MFIEKTESPILKTFKYRVYPTEKQIRIMAQWLEECRLLFNYSRRLPSKLNYHNPNSRWANRKKSRCPGINGYLIGANRTLQGEFVDYHLNPFIEDPVKFNSKLMEYFISHSTKRVYKGLGNSSPIDFVLKYYPESQMYVTRTIH